LVFLDLSQALPIVANSDQVRPFAAFCGYLRLKQNDNRLQNVYFFTKPGGIVLVDPASAAGGYNATKLSPTGAG